MQYTRSRYNRRKLSEFDHSPEEETNVPHNTSSVTAANYRPLRSTRNQVSQEESDDDQVLSQLSGSSMRNRPRRNYRKFESVSTYHFSSNRVRNCTGEDSDHADRPNGNQPSSRRHATATITRQQIPTSSHQSVTETTRLHRSHVQEDHNYGEPGPSSLRLSRRTHVTLSRHQRNADELDMSTTSLESDPLGSPSILLRLRQRTATATTSQLASSTSQTDDRILRIRSNGDQDDLEDIDINVDDDDDDDDDLSDPDDDKPLRYVANRSSGDGLTESMRNRRGVVAGRYRNSSEDEYAGAGPSTSRTTRTQKRPYYNEESDDDGAATGAASTSKKRLLSGGGGGTSAADVGSSSSTRSSHGIASNLRNHSTQPQNPLQLDEDADSDGDQPPSVSSRGRVRKITAKARGLFRE